MARGPSTRPETQPTDSADERDGSSNEGLLGRRAVLAAAGAALTAGPAVAGASRPASSAFETITVPADQREVVELDDCETLEDVLIDVTADGASVTIAAYGTDWTIRNVAVRGQVDMGDECVIGAADTGAGTSRIENVYLGDGAVYEEKGGTGLWVSPEHDGHLEVNRVYVENMGDNAFYCSAPGSGGGGTVGLRRCYSKNCWVSHYRLSEGVVEECVAVNDDDRTYRRGRGVWGWAPGPVEVRGCHLAMNGRHYSFQAGGNGDGGAVRVIDTQWDDGFEGGYREPGGSMDFRSGNGTDPVDGVPAGCPSGVEEAVLAGIGYGTGDLDGR